MMGSAMMDDPLAVRQKQVDFRGEWPVYVDICTCGTRSLEPWIGCRVCLTGFWAIEAPRFPSEGGCVNEGDR